MQTQLTGQKRQKRLVRIITYNKYNAHTDQPFKCTEILKVAYILVPNALKFYRQYRHGQLQSYLCSFNMLMQGCQHPYNTPQQIGEKIGTDLRIQQNDSRIRIYLLCLINMVPLHLLKVMAIHGIQGFSFRIKMSFPKPNECFIVNW